jgi:8-oxo-dGTP pyrophosphatase MutT (NUDIX family)
VRDSRQQLTPFSYVIFRCEEFVLLQLRQGTGYFDGYWSTAAAGHVEANESAQEAASREVREELGISINANELLPLVVMHRKQNGNKCIQGEWTSFSSARPGRPSHSLWSWTRLPISDGSTSTTYRYQWFHMNSTFSSPLGQEYPPSSLSDSLRVPLSDPATA